MASVTVGSDQMQHPHLSAFVFAADCTATKLLHPRAILRLQQEILTHSRMRHVGFDSAINSREFFKIGAPICWHRIRISQPIFIKVIDPRGIGAADMGGTPLPIHRAVLHYGVFPHREGMLTLRLLLRSIW